MFYLLITKQFFPMKKIKILLINKKTFFFLTHWVDEHSRWIFFFQDTNIPGNLECINNHRCSYSIHHTWKLIKQWKLSNDFLESFRIISRFTSTRVSAAGSRWTKHTNWSPDLSCNKKRLESWDSMKCWCDDLGVSKPYKINYSFWNFAPRRFNIVINSISLSPFFSAATLRFFFCFPSFLQSRLLPLKVLLEFYATNCLIAFNYKQVSLRAVLSYVA